ncbi:HAD-IA family hydrolase [Anaerobiospirillum sp. NML120449]|nr:HAD-IA family hydrolase [Anaerobiospirillum sp. NML120449]
MTLKFDDGLKEQMSNVRLIAFDVDGTLTDSIDQIILCFTRTFSHCGLPVPSAEAVKGTIGMSLYLGIKSLLPDPTDERLAAEVTQLYRDTFAVSKDINVTRLFDGTLDMLAALKDHGYELAIASGKSKVGVDRLFVDVPELKQYFSVICTGDDCESKPSPAMINLISARSGTPVDRIIGVGDAVLDIQMLRNAGAHELAVLTGACDYYAFDDLDTEFILPKATDILKYI